MMIAQLAGKRCRNLKVDKNIKIDIKNDEKMETSIYQLAGERCRNLRVPDPHPTATVIPHQSQHYRSDCHIIIIIQHYTRQIVIS